jgi:hypothetical protein
MDSRDHVTRAHDDRRTKGWVATFTFLDVSSTISSSQFHRLVASVRTFWLRTVGRFI